MSPAASPAPFPGVPAPPVRDAGSWTGGFPRRRKDRCPRRGALPPHPGDPQVGPACGAGRARGERGGLLPPSLELPVGGRGGRGVPGPPRDPASLRAPASPGPPRALSAGAPAKRTGARPPRRPGRTGAWTGRWGVAYGHDGRGQWFLVSWHRAPKTWCVPRPSSLAHLHVSSAYTVPAPPPGPTSPPGSDPSPRLREVSLERVTHSLGSVRFKGGASVSPSGSQFPIKPRLCQPPHPCHRLARGGGRRGRGGGGAQPLQG